MEHITDNIVGKTVVGPGGEEIGKITAVEGDRAILKAQTGIAAEMEEGLTSEGEETLSVGPNQIETVEDDRIHLGTIA